MINEEKQKALEAALGQIEPTLPLNSKFFDTNQRHILRIQNEHPTKIQYKNQSKPSALLHTG